MQYEDNTTRISGRPIWKAAARRIPGMMRLGRSYFTIRETIRLHHDYLSRIARETYGSPEPLFDTYQDYWSHDRTPEQERYRLILDAMQSRRTRWGNAIEIGCSKGLFTTQLATLCDSVLACDISPRACALTTERCAQLPNVTVKLLDAKRDTIDGEYDMVCVMDTLIYVHGLGRLQRVIGKLVRAVRLSGILVFSDSCLPEFYKRALWQRWIPEGADQQLAILSKREDLQLIYRRLHQSPADPVYPDHLIAIFEKIQPPNVPRNR